MQDNTVAIQPGPAGSCLTFAPRFNVAAAFIDRHLADGRAIRTATEDVTYAALAERVARCGNALRRLGIPPGGRLLMVVLDGPAFFYLFWGAIKAGIVPVPLNTLLRANDYAYLIEDSACAGIAYSAELAAEIEPALAQPHHRAAVAIRTAGEGATLLNLMAAAEPVLAPAATAPGEIATGCIPPVPRDGRRAWCMPIAAWR
jgi:acyl-CoA synthetase (AMP-forming)/AMP-acid ligase II